VGADDVSPHAVTAASVAQGSAGLICMFLREMGVVDLRHRDGIGGVLASAHRGGQSASEHDPFVRGTLQLFHPEMGFAGFCTLFGMYRTPNTGDGLPSCLWLSKSLGRQRSSLSL
jgi:hypothetical protein